MSVLAAGGGATALGAWAYFVILAAAAASYLGVPLVGTAIIGLAGSLASDGRLNLAGVLVAALIGCELGGLAGYEIGTRWGRRLLERPGRGLAWRTKALAKGERIYAKWGRAAVFVTPAIICGVLRMNFRQFAVWNLLAGAAFVLSVGPGAYAIGRLAAGHHDAGTVAVLVAGLAIAGLAVTLLVFYRRRRRQRPREVTASTP